MIYTREVENMCIVGRDTGHGPAPIPEEGGDILMIVPATGNDTKWR